MLAMLLYRTGAMSGRVFGGAGKYDHAADNYYHIERLIAEQKLYLNEQEELKRKQDELSTIAARIIIEEVEQSEQDKLVKDIERLKEESLNSLQRIKEMQSEELARQIAISQAESELISVMIMLMAEL